MSGLDKINKTGEIKVFDSRGMTRIVTQAAEEWLDEQGYDLGKTSVDQELDYWAQMRGMLNDRGVPLKDLPGRGRLIMSYRVDRLAQLAYKRWKQKSCEGMPYSFMEYVRDGMIWPVESREHLADTVDHVKQLEDFIQSIPGIKRVCKDNDYNVGAMYVKTFDSPDKQMYLVIRLATPVGVMLSSAFNLLYHHPTAPYVTEGIKILHNLYQKHSKHGDVPDRRPGYYNIPGLPQQLHHIGQGEGGYSVLDAGESYNDPEWESTKVEDVINSIKQINDWTEEHTRGTDNLADFDF